jgi:hypothetical protein
MLGLYGDPKGESIFERTTAMSHPSFGTTKDSDSEVPGLHRRVKELENKVQVSFDIKLL